MPRLGSVNLAKYVQREPAWLGAGDCDDRRWSQLGLIYPGLLLTVAAVGIQHKPGMGWGRPKAKQSSLPPASRQETRSEVAPRVCSGVSRAAATFPLLTGEAAVSLPRHQRE